MIKVYAGCVQAQCQTMRGRWESIHLLWQGAWQQSPMETDRRLLFCLLWNPPEFEWANIVWTKCSSNSLSKPWQAVFCKKMDMLALKCMWQCEQGENNQDSWPAGFKDFNVRQDTYNQVWTPEHGPLTPSCVEKQSKSKPTGRAHGYTHSSHVST